MSLYDLDDPVYYSITQCITLLMLNHPFFGQLASRMDVEMHDGDSWCQTAATDGKKLYFNRTFVSNMSTQELMFVVGHEILHVLYDHMGRRRGRDPQLFNMANDYIVNYTLNHPYEGKSSKIGKMPSMGLYDPRFTDEMTSEEVYDILKRNSVEIKMPLDQHLDSAMEMDDGDGDKDGNAECDGNGNGNGNGKTAKITVTGKNGPPKLSKADLEEIQQAMRSAAIQAQQTVGAGNTPLGVRRLIADLIEPKLDWRSMLDSHLRSAIKDDYTFQRLSRRDFGSFIMPSQDILEVVEVDVAVDTSGSMSPAMLRDIFSEVRGIVQSFPDFKLRVWTFDTEVYGLKEFGPHNLSEIEDYAATAQGGGGTMFECNWEFMRQNEISPHRLVLFTDGYPCGTWGEPDYCDTLFVIHGNTRIVAPFGQTCYYEEPETLKEAA